MSSPQIRSTTDIDTVFPLVEITNLILTHFMDDRDHIFEIHFQGKCILCVGKKSDSDDLQMQTAQFYSSIRDQWEANVSPSQAQTSTTTTAGVTSETSSKPTGEIRRKRSIYRRPPCGRDNEDKDLHELYAFTGEKIGEGRKD
jgi:hypothetical protein